MWALISTRLRTWLFAVVVVPLLGKAARAITGRMRSGRRDQSTSPSGTATRRERISNRRHLKKRQTART